MASSRLITTTSLRISPDEMCDGCMLETMKWLQGKFNFSSPLLMPSKNRLSFHINYSDSKSRRSASVNVASEGIWAGKVLIAWMSCSVESSQTMTSSGMFCLIIKCLQWQDAKSSVTWMRVCSCLLAKVKKWDPRAKGKIIRATSSHSPRLPRSEDFCV